MARLSFVDARRKPLLTFWSSLFRPIYLPIGTLSQLWWMPKDIFETLEDFASSRENIVVCALHGRIGKMLFLP